MVKSGHMAGRILLILCNLAACFEGRAALLDSDAVECLVGMLRENELDSESAQESCVAVLFGLSFGGLSFKGLAKTQLKPREQWKFLGKKDNRQHWNEGPSGNRGRKGDGDGVLAEIGESTRLTGNGIDFEKR